MLVFFCVVVVVVAVFIVAAVVSGTAVLPVPGLHASFAIDQADAGS